MLLNTMILKTSKELGIGEQMKGCKVFLVLFLAINLNLVFLNLKAYAKEPSTFYGKMKQSLSQRDDLKKHYSFHRKLGALVRFAPIEYQMLGLAGMTTISFVFKEVFWDLILRQGEFDMKDAAANFKGLKDGLNGTNELEENEFRKNLQDITALTRQLVIDTRQEILVQKATIAELKHQYNQLKEIDEIRKKQEYFDQEYAAENEDNFVPLNCQTK